MTTKTVLTIIIIGALVVGGYTMVKRSNTSSLQQESTLEQTTPEEGKKMAFSAFLENESGSFQCSVSQLVSDVENKGTLYISAEKLRGDFSTIAEGRTVESSMIIKDGYQYLWSSAMPTGMKMAVTSLTGAPAQATQDTGTYSWNAEQIGDYDCQPWTPIESTFALPSGVTFTDFSQMMQPQ